MANITISITGLRLPTRDAGWDESKHKRDGGKFSSTGGSGGGEGGEHPAGHYLIHTPPRDKNTNRQEAKIVSGPHSHEEAKKIHKNQGYGKGKTPYLGLNQEHDMVHHDGKGNWHHVHHDTVKPLNGEGRSGSPYHGPKITRDSARCSTRRA